TARLDAPARLAVVADTHSAPHPDAARHLAAQRPDGIIHAGVIGDPSLLDRLAEIAPVHAIRGNIDARGLPDELVIDIGDDLRVLVVHIGVAGPHLRADAAKLARTERARLVVCGHSH